MDVFKLAIHGTGYPLPGGDDEFRVLVYNDERSGVGMPPMTLQHLATLALPDEFPRWSGGNYREIKMKKVSERYFSRLDRDG